MKVIEIGLRLTWCKENDVLHKAFNDRGEYLGYLSLEQVGAYRHWCWYQENEMRMSPGCLDEVRSKQKLLWRG